MSNQIVSFTSESNILIPKDAQLNIYNETAETYNQVAQDFRDKNMQIVPVIEQEILQMLSLIPAGGRVLDAGCGSGIYTIFMGLLGYNVKGIDFSEAQINLARSSLGNDKVEFYKANILNYLVSPSEYDAILINSMFHHILKQDREAFLKKMTKGLKPNGRILLITRTHEVSEQRIIESMKLGKRTLRIASRSNKEELFNLIESAGLIVETSFRTEPHPDDPEGIFHHLILKKRVNFEF